jgi:hypothetical protein
MSEFTHMDLMFDDWLCRILNSPNLSINLTLYSPPTILYHQQFYIINNSLQQNNNNQQTKKRQTIQASKWK